MADELSKLSRAMESVNVSDRPPVRLVTASFEGALEREAKRRETERRELRELLVAEINAADEHLLRELVQGYFLRRLNERLK